MTAVGERLETALDRWVDELRDPALVMAPETLGAARLSRYSFSRMLLRRVFADAWDVRRVRFNLDDLGRGESAYEVVIDDLSFHFVAFTTTIDESLHTDRVVADDWEITGALVEGPLAEDLMGVLRAQVPLQEAGRLDPRVLVITRGNRSVRFFQYVVDRLAAGLQPDPEHVGDAGYIMRSTAFYGNGKFGMRSFEGYEPGHPLAVPYRSQMLAAWLYRELSYDVAEHCARAQGGSTAVPFDDEWSHFFGLGNATGLGLVPYALKHPQVIHAWVAIREVALAEVRELSATPRRVAHFEKWIDRAHTFFESGTHDDCTPFLNPQQLVPLVGELRVRFEELQDHERVFDELYRWAEQQSRELMELVVALLIELHEGDDREVEDQLRVDERVQFDPAMAVCDLLDLVEDRFGWIDNLDLDAAEADHFWWLVSDNTEEPRRAPSKALDRNGRDVAIDIALRVWRLRETLRSCDPNSAIQLVLAQHPHHRLAAERVVASDVIYGEPRDNVCGADYLPLQLQRFQLAMYGMDNFKPKSTDWLRVTLMQGAPRIADLSRPTGVADDWALPPRPRSNS